MEFMKGYGRNVPTVQMYQRVTKVKHPFTMLHAVRLDSFKVRYIKFKF